MEEDPSRQDRPAQTPPATARRTTILGPAAVIATGAVIALPLAEHLGLRLTILAAGMAAVVIGTCWLIGRERDPHRRDSRDGLRGEAAIRQRIADLELRQDALLAQVRSTARMMRYILKILSRQHAARRAGGAGAAAVAALRRQVRQLAEQQETLAGYVADGLSSRVVLDISTEDAYELGRRVGRDERGGDQIR